MAFRTPISVPDLSISAQLNRFPTSRYMGSKQAILPFLYDVLSNLEFTSALDAFSGSGVVSYLLKAMGKSVTSNDFLTFCYHTAQACIVNSEERLTPEGAVHLLTSHPSPQDFVETNFAGLYFTDEENRLLDNLTANIRAMTSPLQQSIAYAALARACFRRRPRGLFTYTGIRYEDGRRDLAISLEQHFQDAVALFDAAVFDNGHAHQAFNQNVFTLPDAHYDLVYIDTPYVSPHSDNDYTRRYHFVEGLVRYWEGLEILHTTTTKKFRRLPSLFDSKRTVREGFEQLFERYQDSILVVSYSSSGIPSKEEMIAMLEKVKPGRVEVYEQAHLYSHGTHGHKVGDNKNRVFEYLFVGR